MKHILFIIISSLFCLVSSGSVGNYVIDTEIIKDHEYIIVSSTDHSGGISIVHSESCNCKKTKEELRKEEQGPRLFSLNMRLKKYEEQNGMCPHCTNHFEFAQMQGDHIVPYSKGGKTEYSNLQMLCIKCNQTKGNKYSY